MLTSRLRGSVRHATASEVSVRVDDRQVTLAEGGPTTTVPTHIYSTVLPGSTTTFDQAFAFYDQPALGRLALVDFTLGASTLKWSLNFTGGGQAAAFTVRYRLSALGAAAATGNTSTARPTISRRTATPAANMTTYSIPLRQLVTASSPPSSHELGAQLVVFDVAMVDDQLVPLLSHNVMLVESSSSSSSVEYVLELTFPPFTSSLYYDPSLALGVLLDPGRSKGSQSSSSGDLSSVIGVATGLPCGLIVVVVAGILLVVAKRKREVRRIRRLRRDLEPPYWLNLPENKPGPPNVLGGLQTNELYKMPH